MISSLRGQVLSNLGGTAVLEVGGVGFAVSVTTATALRLTPGEEAFLFTSMVVREDAISLFGFANQTEQQVFTILNSVSGVGPRIAMAVLGAVSVPEIVSAVATENDSVFKSVSGVGPKLAKLIVVSLAGKLDSVVLAGTPISRPDKSLTEQLSTALSGLGYPQARANNTASNVVEALPNAELSELLKRALSELASVK